jgi:hypothetical protein
MSKWWFKGMNQRSIEVLEGLVEYNACKAMFNVVGWKTFFGKFQGYNDQVALKFIEGFNGKFSHIGKLVMNVSENIVS